MTETLPNKNPFPDWLHRAIRFFHTIKSSFQWKNFVSRDFLYWILIDSISKVSFQLGLSDLTNISHFDIFLMLLQQITFEFYFLMIDTKFSKEKFKLDFKTV